MTSKGTKRTTVNLPEDLLRDALAVSGKGITETIIDGLRAVKRSHAYEKAQKLRGKLDLSIDLAVSRERSHR